MSNRILEKKIKKSKEARANLIEKVSTFSTVDLGSNLHYFEAF